MNAYRKSRDIFHASLLKKCHKLKTRLSVCMQGAYMTMLIQYTV